MDLRKETHSIAQRRYKVLFTRKQLELFKLMIELAYSDLCSGAEALEPYRKQVDQLRYKSGRNKLISKS